MSLPPQRPQNPMPSNTRNRPPRSNIRFEGASFSFFPQDDSTPPTQGEQQQQTAQGEQQQPAQGGGQQGSSSVGSSSLGEYSQEDKEYIDAMHKKFRPGFVAPNSTATNVHDLRTTNLSRAAQGLAPIRMAPRPRTAPRARFEGERLQPTTRPPEQETQQETPYPFFPEE